MHLSISQAVLDLVAPHIGYLELMTLYMILYRLEIPISIDLDHFSIESFVVLERFDAASAIIYHQIDSILGAGIHYLPLSL